MPVAHGAFTGRCLLDVRRAGLLPATRPLSDLAICMRCRHRDNGDHSAPSRDRYPERTARIWSTPMRPGVKASALPAR